ncbi:hypothetical protein ACS0TY_009609 [Phlomoides rotata]
MVCDKSGSSRANKTSKRVGCTARLKVIRHDNGRWIILKMVTEHNHEIDPTFSPLMPAHMQLNVHMKRQLETNDITDRCLRNVLWIHPRSMAAYEEFHDVVSFDMTYLVNRYKMPLASIVGVNQHRYSILLGCALNWLQAMNGVHPNVIITDQCPSINFMIRDVMPNTTHRYCIWHIMSKVPEKFKYIGNFHRYCVDFKGIVYESLIIENFETQWAEFLV